MNVQSPSVDKKNLRAVRLTNKQMTLAWEGVMGRTKALSGRETEGRLDEVALKQTERGCKKALWPSIGEEHPGRQMMLPVCSVRGSGCWSLYSKAERGLPRW